MSAFRLEEPMTLCAALFALVLLGQKPAAPPAPPADQNPTPDGPVVALETSMGTIKIGLFKTKAPLSTDNFLRYVREGFYDGTIFHRVIPGFMIQGGGFTPDMKEKAVHAPVKNEAKNMLRNSRGTVSLARTNDPNSASSQFFINLKSNHTLDFGIMGAGYTVFGAVLEGMDVVDGIAGVSTGARGPHENVPNTPVVIKKARLESAPAPVPPPGSSP
jgi:cyclophilin family peptidyl-prolyl cis-trans isomerase